MVKNGGSVVKHRRVARIQKNSLVDSNNTDHVFSEGLPSLDCVKSLCNCIKNVEKQTRKVHNKTDKTKMS